MTDTSPFQTPTLLGHDSALAQFQEAFASGRLHHAWLITGNEGIGKATLAAHLTHFLLSNGQNKPGQLDMNHPAARLIAAESHPDLIVVQRPLDEKSGQRKDTIPIEDARRIEPFLRLTSTHSQWRVAVIDEAHALSWNGQNAILKVVEEPPKNCVLLITATTAGALLPTIRSRCRALPLQPLQPATLQTLMARSDADWGQEAAKARLLAYAGGSFGLAQRFLDAGVLELLDQTEALFDHASGLDVPALHAMGDKMSKKADSEAFPLLSQLLLEGARQAAQARASQTQEPAHLPFFYKGLPLDPLLVLWDKLNEIFAQARESNLDRKLTFLAAMQEIKRARS